ncbi:hypothetical protein EMCG_07083 [[Emmonsia] crescens]|uniref:Uncharacterized protein n=1 Tax=[Emmonsia] crescens TaxID=73230 RepID=A0A0G2I998_9EURO|nr:hypothetical protein EMCG_07083 [Emmonsia crescens UAMH 3008]
MFFSALLLLLPLVLGNQHREIKCRPEGQGIASTYIEGVAERFCSFAKQAPYLHVYVSYPGTGSGADALKPENMVHISWQKDGNDCPCVEVFAEMLKDCCHNVDCLWGGSGTVHGACGIYSLIVSEQSSTPSLRLPSSGVPSASSSSLTASPPSERPPSERPPSATPPSASPPSLTIPSGSPPSPTILPSACSPAATSSTKAPVPTVQICNARAGHGHAASDTISKILEDQFCPDAVKLQSSVSLVYTLDTAQKVKIEVQSVDKSAFQLNLDDCLQFLRDMVLNYCARNNREFPTDLKGEGLVRTDKMTYAITVGFKKEFSEAPCSITHPDDFHEFAIQGNGWANADFRNSELGRMLKDKPTEFILYLALAGQIQVGPKEWKTY